MEFSTRMILFQLVYLHLTACTLGCGNTNLTCFCVEHPVGFRFCKYPGGFRTIKQKGEIHPRGNDCWAILSQHFVSISGDLGNDWNG